MFAWSRRRWNCWLREHRPVAYELNSFNDNRDACDRKAAQAGAGAVDCRRLVGGARYDDGARRCVRRVHLNIAVGCIYSANKVSCGERDQAAFAPRDFVYNGLYRLGKNQRSSMQQNDACCKASEGCDHGSCRKQNDEYAIIHNTNSSFSLISVAHNEERERKSEGPRRGKMRTDSSASPRSS